MMKVIGYVIYNRKTNSYLHTTVSRYGEIVSGGATIDTATIYDDEDRVNYAKSLYLQKSKATPKQLEVYKVIRTIETLVVDHVNKKADDKDIDTLPTPSELINEYFNISYGPKYNKCESCSYYQSLKNNDCSKVTVGDTPCTFCQNNLPMCR